MELPYWKLVAVVGWEEVDDWGEEDYQREEEDCPHSWKVVAEGAGYLRS